MLDIIKLLYENGCDINKTAEDSLKNTPIHSSCRRGLEVILAWLIEKRANCNVKDTTHQTPLEYLDKQINNINYSMDETTKARLIQCRNLLLKDNKNSNEKLYTIGKFGLFATAVVGGVIAANSIVVSNLM